MKWNEFFNAQVFKFNSRITSVPEYKLYVGFNILNDVYIKNKTEIDKLAATHRLLKTQLETHVRFSR